MGYDVNKKRKQKTGDNNVTYRSGKCKTDTWYAVIVINSEKEPSIQRRQYKEKVQCHGAQKTLL